MSNVTSYEGIRRKREEFTKIWMPLLYSWNSTVEISRFSYTPTAPLADEIRILGYKLRGILFIFYGADASKGNEK